MKFDPVYAGLVPQLKIAGKKIPGHAPTEPHCSPSANGIFRDGGTPSSWLAVLDKVAALNALHVLPDHSAPGDGSMVQLEKQFISDLRNSALGQKKTGVAVEEAGKRLETEFKAKYPAWPNMNVSGFVRNIYAE